MLRLRACVVLSMQRTRNFATGATCWRQLELPAAESNVGRSLEALSENAATELRATMQRCAVFESTTGGLINAALLSAPGASRFTSCGAVSYTSSRAVAVLGPDPARPLGEPLDATGHRSRPQHGAEYIASKQERVQALARRKRLETGATWCICENGACGPTFAYPDVHSGFTAIFVSGPVERGVLVRSPHARREDNMWAFSRAALDLLAECVAEASAMANAASASPGAPAPPAPPALLDVKEDRYGGVEVSVRDGGEAELSTFVDELHAALDGWRAAEKQGVWLRLSIEAHSLISAAVCAGFRFHHATSEYLQLTKWLPPTPCPLPRYAFTTIGVGGVVVNSKGEVLMVQERVSPSPRMQASWKLCARLKGSNARAGRKLGAAPARSTGRCAIARLFV